ncbi:DUF91 domain-containing protein [Pseudanabaena sp. FACHB-1998]|uniref:endonuclease NucS domain-containing protein n=1 Tax=Pseudanabaena sp. FACHB-1998 TaxID=2692858 RepID=UPI0016806220|nr:endonuclease NucS domain-containing protein [Pseudanabaena sp. FACHB-1998]MBD2179020.1 DUF91 domain-containing protein [Pseudanabaena sp. FACHB-1998]
MTNQDSPILPRFRIYGGSAEFETERHLEWFFWYTVLPKIGLKPLKSQHTCREGICDILAKGNQNQLVIVELKNVEDSHVIEQITAYFDALIEEKPFSEQIDYTKSIELYTVCPTYRNRTVTTLKHHKLKFTLFSYAVKSSNQGFIFTLYEWLTNIEIAKIDIPIAVEIAPTLNLPDPPKAFVNLLGNCSECEKIWAIEIRDQIYQFAQSLNYKIYEKPYGKWVRFERNKQNPIAEIGWENKRESLVVYLWLPFMTVNGQCNMRRDSYKRTAMMRLWIDDGIVRYVGYIENQRKSWLVVTDEEIQKGKFTKPVKLQRKGLSAYWKGLAMPTDIYLDLMGFTPRSHSLNSFVELSLEHSLQRLTKSRQKTIIEVEPDF